WGSTGLPARPPPHTGPGACTTGPPPPRPPAPRGPCAASTAPAPSPLATKLRRVDIGRSSLGWAAAAFSDVTSCSRLCDVPTPATTALDGRRLWHPVWGRTVFRTGNNRRYFSGEPGQRVRWPRSDAVLAV